VPSYTSRPANIGACKCCHCRFVQAHLVQATLGRSNSALIAQGISPVYMCEGDGGDLASDPLSPQGKSHEEGEEEGEEEEGASSVGGYDEGAPPGDPLSR
jgi:hypothetical protein